MKKILIKRVYDTPSKSDGYRVLIVRIWPRGVSKEDAKLDAWNKELAPSTQLRKWFDHDPNKFDAFIVKYKTELEDRTDALKQLRQTLKKQTVTLLYGTKDNEHNQALVLKKVLEDV